MDELHYTAAPTYQTLLSYYQLQILLELTATPVCMDGKSVLLNELLDLLRYRYEQIDFIDKRVKLGFDCPLDLYCGRVSHRTAVHSPPGA